ncbi:hypothetical protein HOB95_00955 [bacterium]|nr:hypothetical protein [bacterium]
MKSVLDALYLFCVTTLHITQIKDLVEISFFMLIAYNFSSWLSRSKRRPMLLQFYGYSAMIIATYAFNAKAAHSLLIWSAPACIMLALIYHQHTLQRSFIPSRKIGAKALTTSAWIDDLVRALVHSMHAGKKVICLIEHRDDLSLLFESPIRVNAAISAKLVKMLVNSSDFNQQQYLWVDSQGLVKAVNATVSTESQAIFQDSRHSQHAVIADKTDSIVCIVDPTAGNFTLHAQSKTLNGIPAAQIAPLLCAYLGYRVNLSSEKSYAKPRSKNRIKLDRS